jgi:hypothetical protein
MLFRLHALFPVSFFVEGPVYIYIYIYCGIFAQIQRALEHKINEEGTQSIYFSHRPMPPEAQLTLNERNIPFVNHVKYLDVAFSKRIT